MYAIFARWVRAGVWQRIHDALRDRARSRAVDTRCRPGRSSTPSRQGADTVARSSRGYDAGKKINGRKRHIAVDTNGLLLAVVVTMAGILWP
nr:hypothetical protein GCM10017611_12700 [Rhodococcus wratislaviensis]